MSILSKFHYQVMGKKSGFKMVFLHGVMGFGANWKTLANHFSSEFEILLFDQRGHGRSFQPEAGFAPSDYAQDLKQILAELGWDKVVLIGHSMGGRNAVQFASLFPEKLSALVIVDIGPVSDQKSMDLIREKIEFVPTPFENRESARAFFDEKFITKYPDSLVKQFFYANLVEKSGHQMDWRFSKSAILETLKVSRAINLWDQFEQLSMPTLLLRGENSQDFPRELFKEVLSRNPRIEGIEVARAGHWVHVDSPQATLEAINHFLRSKGLMTS